MLRFRKIKLWKNKDYFKSRKDELRVEELINDENVFEYIIINDAYNKFNQKDRFSIGIKVVFHKDNCSDVIERDNYFQLLEFKFKEYIKKRKGMLIFSFTAEKKKVRETLFYTTQDTSKLLKISDLNFIFDFYQGVEIIIKNDPKWDLKLKYAKHYNYEKSIKGLN